MEREDRAGCEQHIDWENSIGISFLGPGLLEDMQVALEPWLELKEDVK